MSASVQIDTTDPLGAGQRIVSELLMPLLQDIGAKMDARERVHLWASVMSGLSGAMVADVGRDAGRTILGATLLVVSESPAPSPEARR